MTHDPTPDDEFPELDLEVHARVRAALRQVPQQPPEQADRARAVALGHLSVSQRPRRPVWLSVAAAGIVVVVGVAVLGRGVDAPPPAEPIERAADDSAVAMMQPEVQARSAASGVAPLNDADLGAIAAWVRASEPVSDAVCPLDNAERSYGVRLVGGVEVEVLVDTQRGLLRIVDLATCVMLGTATIVP